MIFQTVLNMSIQGTYIAAALILLRFVLKKLPRRYLYALWLILGIRLLCPFSFASPLSFFNLIMPETQNHQMTFIPNGIEYQAMPQVTVSVAPVNDVINESLVKNFAPQPVASANPLQIVGALASLVWLFGVIVMLIYTGISYLSVHRRVRGAKLLRENIYACSAIASPFVYDILKPRIYLPDNVPEKELPYILAHENVHIKRGDHLVKLLAMGILCLHWFNPLVWASYFLMTADMELSCDELAITGLGEAVRKDYAATLLNMSARQNGILPGGVLSFGESNIKTRIKSVLTAKKLPAVVTVLAVVAIVLAAFCLLTNNVSSSDAKLPELKDYNSFTLVSNTAARNCTPQEITELIVHFDDAELEKIDPAGHIFTDIGEIRMYRSANWEGEYQRVWIARSDEQLFILHTSAVGDFKTYANDYTHSYSLADNTNIGVYHFNSAQQAATLLNDLANASYYAFTGKITWDTSAPVYIVTADNGGAFFGDFSVTSEEPLQFGDRVKVWFQGAIMETIPLQIHQVRLEKLENEPKQPGVFSIIKTVYTFDSKPTDAAHSNAKPTEEQIVLTLSTPAGWETDGISVFYHDSAKAMELSSVFRGGKNFPREYFTVDVAYGSEIRVIEEEHYEDSNLLYTDLYHTQTFSPEISGDGLYEKYAYVIERNGYETAVSFVVNESFDRGTCEEILKSIVIEQKKR